MLDRATASEFLTTTGATGSTMDQRRQRGTMAGGLFRTIAVQHQHAAMPGGRANDNPRRLVVISGDQGTGQAAFAQARDLDGFLFVLVGHDRADRAKGFNGVSGRAITGLVAIQERGWKERAFAGVSTDDFETAYGSFSVRSRVEQAKAKVRAYRVTGTPSMIVNGKYRVDGRMAGSNTRMLEVVDFLVQREQAALTAAAE